MKSRPKTVLKASSDQPATNPFTFLSNELILKIILKLELKDAANFMLAEKRIATIMHTSPIPIPSEITGEGKEGPLTYTYVEWINNHRPAWLNNAPVPDRDTFDGIDIEEQRAIMQSLENTLVAAFAERPPIEEGDRLNGYERLETQPTYVTPVDDIDRFYQLVPDAAHRWLSDYFQVVRPTCFKAYLESSQQAKDAKTKFTLFYKEVLSTYYGLREAFLFNKVGRDEGVQDHIDMLMAVEHLRWVNALKMINVCIIQEISDEIRYLCLDQPLSKEDKRAAEVLRQHNNTLLTDNLMTALSQLLSKSFHDNHEKWHIHINLRDLELSEMCCEKMNLSGVDLRGSNFQYAVIERVDFSHAQLQCVNFSGARMWCVNLNGVNLRDLDLSGLNLTRAKFAGVTNLPDAYLIAKTDCMTEHKLLEILKLKYEQITANIKPDKSFSPNDKESIHSHADDARLALANSIVKHLYAAYCERKLTVEVCCALIDVALTKKELFYDNQSWLPFYAAKSDEAREALLTFKSDMQKQSNLSNKPTRRQVGR